MANEITVAASISVSNGGASIASGTLSKSLTQVGTNMGTVTMSIPTTAGGTVLTKPGSVSALGHFCLKNLDATNYLELSNATGDTEAHEFTTGVFAKVQPGAAILMEISTLTAIYARANTAAVQVQYWMAEV